MKKRLKYMIEGMKLIELDINNKEHIDFTYNLLKQRYKKEYINLKHSLLPSYEDHIKVLKSNRYICFCLLEFYGIIFGKFFINNNFEFGAYLDTSCLRKLVELKKTLPKPILKPYINEVMRKKNIKTIYTKINLKNPASLLAAKKIGVELISIDKNVVSVRYSL